MTSDAAEDLSREQQTAVDWIDAHQAEITAPVRLLQGAVAPDDLTIPPYYPRGWRPPGDTDDDGV